MAYRRASRFKRRRRTGGRMVRRPRIRRFRRRTVGNIIHKFKRTQNTAISIVMNGIAAETFGSFFFQLDSLNAYTEFTQLFDQYRIAGVKLQFFPRLNSFSYGDTSATLQNIPPLCTVIDLDDAVAQSSGTLNEYGNCRWHYMYRPFKVFLRPKPSAYLYDGTGTPVRGAVVPAKQWIDCNRADVPHYGFKWGTALYSTANNATVDPAWDVAVTYYLEFRHTR